MKLADLLPPDLARPGNGNGNGNEIEIAAITADSRQVEPGTLFAALSGARFDGAQFIADAVARGAAAVLVSDQADIQELPVPIIRSGDPRRSLALMAARYYGRQPQVTVAVTGTSGKTSVAEFTRQIFAHAGRQAASLGTIGIVRPDGGVYGALTTPDPVTLHGVLAGLADDGITHLAFEASSHGLDQRRLDGVQLSAGAFTNLGRDHLDYHPTIEHYLAAKCRLFDTLLPAGCGAVINVDDGHATAVLEAARARQLTVLTTGRGAGADLRLVDARPDGFGQVLTWSFDNDTFQSELSLIGTYQALNVLTAAGLALCAGEARDGVFDAIANLRGVSGRLEVVGQVRGATVVVDYAHKPDALAAALDALRPFARGRLINVFGCGGDRDPGKRPIMGAISARKADVTIVTDDNPRSEAPEAIRAAILQAAVGAQEVGDRYEAIATALLMAGPGDVVLIAGKGHETGQVIGDSTLPFSDHEAVNAILREV